MIMSDFNIRIGTFLDTSQAEQQLQEFINKHQNEDNFKLKLDFSEEGDLKDLEKSLQAIVKFAKSLENIKININTDDVSKIQTNVGDTIKKNTQELGQATQEVKKVVGETVEKNIEGFEERVTNVKKAISMAIEDLQSLKLVENTDIGRINELQKQLVEMANIDFDKFGIQGLSLLEEGLQDVNSEYTNLINQARSKQLQNSFNDIKINPLISQMEALKEVMNFKGLDTSGIDNLIAKVRGVSKEGTDLKVASKAVKDVAKDFANMKTALKMTDIKSSETAIKKLLSYREELLKQIPLEIDSSKVEKAEQDVKRIDEAIERLTQNADKSLVKNLIDLSELKNIENMENATEVLHKNADKLSNTFEGLKTKFKQLSQTDFVDPTSIKIVEQYIDEIGQSIKSLDFDNIKVGDLKRISDDLETLGVCIDKVKKDSDEIKIEVKFSNDLSQATTELNGLHSALIKLGKDTNVIEKLQDELKGIDKTATQDLKKAGQDLEEFKDKMKNMAQSMGLGDISGEMSQFTKYVNEVVKLTKQLSTTKDLNFADGIKEQINDVMKALNKLTDGFDDVQKEFAQGFLDDAMKGLSQGFTQEIEKINAEAEKLRVVLYRLSTMEMSEGMAKGLAEEFEKAADKVADLQNALKRALSETDSVDASGIAKLREELEQAKQSMVELGKKKIELDCQETIARVEKLKNEVENLDDVLNKLGGVDAISRIKEDFENGAMSVEKATSALKKYNDTLDKVENNSKQIDKSFDAFESAGSKIEGVFNNIKDGFQRFTFGELLEEGIESAIYGIKETILGLDQAMTELKRVAPDSLKFDDVGYKQIANDAREVAMSVGQSTEDVITGMSTALQAGASTMQQATEIARSSAILQNVSDMGADEASQAIASLVNQYYSMDTALSKVGDKIKGAPKDYNNLTNAIDQINYAGNNYAISTEGVTQALQNGGSVLSSYGVTLSDSIAMITAANESMQDPSRIGNGLRSLAINFAGIKTNAKEGTLEMNKSAKALKEIAGIDIFTDKSKTSVKDMMTLMDEIYDKWDGLTDVQQKGLSEGLAGKTQAAVFQSLMQNWETVKKMQQEYKDGMMVGSAEKENAAYLDSIAGKWNKLKEAMKSLVTNNVSQSFIKGLLDGATKLVQVIEKIMNSLGTIGTGGALLGIASFIKGMASFSKFDGLTGMAKAISTIFTTVKGGSGIFSGITAGLKGLTAGAGAAKIGMIALNGILTGLGWGIAIAGAVAFIKWLDKKIVTTKEAVKAGKELQQSARDEIASLNSQKSSLSAIAQEYDTLSRKVNRTVEEEERLRELRQQIAQIAPELVAGYDENGDPILKLRSSLQQYCNDLDKAIEKQQKLFYEGQAKEADAYMKQNDKKSYKDKYSSLFENSGYDEIDWDGYDLSDAKKSNPLNLLNGGVDTTEAAKSMEKLAEIRQAYREKEEEKTQKHLEALSKTRREIGEKDLAIESSFINDFLDSNSKMNAAQKEMYTGFMSQLGWGTLGSTEAKQYASGLEELSEITKTTRGELSDMAMKATDNARKAFANTGALQTYGKTLQEIGLSSREFDMQSWSEYLDEVNMRFENGTYDVDQYKHALSYMAKTMSELVDIPYETVLKSLMETGDVEKALTSASEGLNRFMKAYGKTTTDLEQGDNVAVLLEKQFDAISKLGTDLDSKMIEWTQTGKIDVEWVQEESLNKDLPEQMRKIMAGLSHDSELHDVEIRFMAQAQAEIQNAGTLSSETIAEIEKLLNTDDTTLDAGFEIAGLKLSGDEARTLKHELQEAGINAKNIEISDTGIKEAVQHTKEVEEALRKIDDVEISIAIEQQGNYLDTVKEIQMMEEATKQFSDKEVKKKFIADTAQYFDGQESVEAAIANLPDHIKLKYNIGIEGNAELEELRNKVNALPESVRTQVYAGTYGAEDVDRLTLMVKLFGETKATALLEIQGVQDAINNATSVDELLRAIAKVVCDPTIEVEGEQTIIDIINKKLDELDKKESTPEVKVKSEGVDKTKKDLQEVNQEGEKVNNKTATKKVKTEGTDKTKKDLQEVNQEGEKVNNETATKKVKTEGADKTKKDLQEVNQEGEKVNKQNPTIKVNAETEKPKQDVNQLIQNTEEVLDTPITGIIDMETEGAQSEVNQLNQKTNEATQPKTGVISLTVQGGEKITLAINEKGKLEKNGNAITNIQLNGGEQLPVAINEKGQLEVAGVALTSIDISGQDQLTVAMNEKGQLEVNGQAVTDIIINGKGEVEAASGAVEKLPDEKSVNVSFNVNNALDSILSALGLNTKNETINITVNCIDNASTTLNNIASFQGTKNVTVSVTCNGGKEALSTVQKINQTQLTTKQFSVTCNSSVATQTLSTLQTRTIPNKTFSITCTDSASNKINTLANRKIANKTFVVSCKDSASSTLNKVGNRKISNKTFTVTCKDSATATLNKVSNKKISNKSFSVSCKDSASTTLSSISSKLSGIKSKTVTVTVKYSQVGKPPSSGGTGPSASEPQVMKMSTPIIVDNTADVSALASTQSNMASVRNAMASVQASYTDTINSSYSWVNASLDNDIDLLQDFNAQLERISNTLDLVSKQADEAFGDAKANLLENQIGLLQQQQRMLRHEQGELQTIKGNLQSLLSNQGFWVDGNGAVTNYASKLLELERAVESAKKAQDAYDGDDKNRQKTLQNAYDSANERLTKAKDTLSEYYDVSNKIGDLANEWEDVGQAIEDAKNEITKARVEQDMFVKEMYTKNLENQYDSLADKMELLETKADVSSDREKVLLLEQQYALLDQQQSKLGQVTNSYKQQLNYYRDFLSQRGFSFDADGNADAFQLNNLKNSNVADYEAIEEAYDMYTELLRDTIPDLEKEWYELEGAQNDIKNSMIELQDEMAEFDRMRAFGFIDQLIQKQEHLDAQLDRLDTKLELTYGSNKTHLLREQIGVINQQMAAIEQVNNALDTQRNYMQSDMFRDGFRFDANGDITNLGELLSLTKTQDEYDRLKEKAQEYYDTQNEIEEGRNQWLEYQSQLEDVKNEIAELELELKNMVHEARITDLNNDLQVLQNQFDKLDSMKGLNNKDDNFAIYERQLELIEEQKKATAELIRYQVERSEELARNLSSYGFTINDNGTIDNTAERLESLKDALSDDEFSRVEGFLEDYFEVALEEIPDLEKQLIEYQVDYQEIQKEKLEVTEKVEKEITKMLEKQLEERIEKIEEERDAQLEALNEQKEAYKKWREDVDYEEDYNEQLLKVQELQNQIDIAKKDDSLSGKKRLENLMEQLNEEQKALEELVEDRMDTLTNEMFDSATEKIEEDANKQIEALEDTYTEERIVEMVAGALRNIDKEFVGIDGKITDLDSALMDFANNSVEYMGVMGNFTLVVE